jgi:hypothetical protein
MALLEADGMRVDDARNALGAMINRSAKTGQDLGKHVSGRIYQPTIEENQRQRLSSVLRSKQFGELRDWAKQRASGAVPDPVNGATHFLAPERSMLSLEAKDPRKYRSWRSWTNYDPQQGAYRGVITRDNSHAFLAPEGAYSVDYKQNLSSPQVNASPGALVDAGPQEVVQARDSNLNKPLTSWPHKVALPGTPAAPWPDVEIGVPEFYAPPGAPTSGGGIGAGNGTAPQGGFSAPSLPPIQPARPVGPPTQVARSVPTPATSITASGEMPPPNQPPSPPTQVASSTPLPPAALEPPMPPPGGSVSPSPGAFSMPGTDKIGGALGGFAQAMGQQNEAAKQSQSAAEQAEKDYQQQLAAIMQRQRSYWRA